MDACADRPAAPARRDWVLAALLGAALPEASAAPVSREQTALFLKIFEEALETRDAQRALAKADGGKALPPEARFWLHSLNSSELKTLAEFKHSLAKFSRPLRESLVKWMID